MWNEKIVNRLEYALYDHEIKRVYEVFRSVQGVAPVPVLDPDVDYLLNIGCGSNPDHIAARAFAGQKLTGEVETQLHVVGVDIQPYQIKYASESVAHNDRVTLIEGEIVEKLPGIIDKYGVPRVAVARNATLLLDDFENDGNPYLRGSWAETIQAVYEAQDVGDCFIVTVKQNQESLRAAMYLAAVGYATFRVEQGCLIEIKDTLIDGLLLGRMSMPISPDQFVYVGVKTDGVDDVYMKSQSPGILSALSELTNQ